MNNVVELNDLNFDKEVKASDLPVLVDFYATWCGPCRKQMPVVAKIAEQFQGKVKVAKIDVDQAQRKSIEYSVASIPTLILFKNGQVIEALSGMHSESQLSNLLNKYAS